MAQAFEVVQPTNSSPLTLIEFILDETGSMSSCRESTISGFNEYINSQRTAPGNCVLSLTKFDVRGGGFLLGGAVRMRGIAKAMHAPIATTVMPSDTVVNNDDDVRTMYTDVPVDKVEYLTEATYQPHGSTNLYDAVGKRIHALSARAEQYTDAAKLVVIMTDGQDNASREYSATSLKALIEQKEKDGWTFVFLGANQDAWSVGQTFGMAKGNTMTYDTANMAATMGTLSASTTRYRSARAMGAVGSTEASRDFFSGVDLGTDKE